MINLIDSEGLFNPTIAQFPAAQANIAIFGSQSSGKSTLLNHAFGTEFPTLNTLKTREQCTKGVWYHHLEKFNLIDTEGFDSIQRMNESRIYERQIALFSLAIADVILINIWMNEIGRYDGGQISILKIILKAARHLIKSQSKTIIFVVKDCTSDAEKSVLQQELDFRVKQLLRESQQQDKSIAIKFNIEYFFMSHFVHHYDKYVKQAKQLPSRIRIRKSQLQHYEPTDRLIYLKHIWQTICTNEDIDLRIEEQALKNFIVNRTRKEVKQQIGEQIAQIQILGPKMSYQRFYQRYMKKSFDLLKEKLPKFLDEKFVKLQLDTLEEELKYVIHNQFNDIIVLNEEKIIIRETLDKEIRKSYKSVQLQRVLTQQKSKCVDLYKALVKGHKQAQIMVQAFALRIAEYSVQYETQVHHLFSQFQIKLETLLNKQLDSQVNKLTFDKDKIQNKTKKLCKEYGYNQWQINFKQIWQKLQDRILTQKLGERIKQASSRLYFTIWSGDKSTQIIDFHKKLQKQCEMFITNILLFFNQDDSGAKHFENAKQKIQQSLEKSLIQEKKRYRVTMLVIGIFMIFFYTEFVMLIKIGHFKKKTRRHMRYGYIFIAVTLLAIQIFKRRAR